MTKYLIREEDKEVFKVLNEGLNMYVAENKDGRVGTIVKADSRYRLEEIPDEEPKLTQYRVRCGECKEELGDIACANEFGGSYCSTTCADVVALRIKAEKAKAQIEEIEESWVPSARKGLDELQFKRNIESILAYLQTTLLQKNADYGDSYAKSVEKYGDTVALIRLGDKLSRLESLLLSNKMPNVCDESIEDTLLDLAGYAILELERRRR